MVAGLLFARSGFRGAGPGAYTTAQAASRRAGRVYARPLLASATPGEPRRGQSGPALVGAVFKKYIGKHRHDRIRSYDFIRRQMPADKTRLAQPAKTISDVTG